MMKEPIRRCESIAAVLGKGIMPMTLWYNLMDIVKVTLLSMNIKESNNKFMSFLK